MVVNILKGDMLGTWYGTSALNPFTKYTALEIFESDSTLKVQRHDRIQAKSPEGLLIWKSNDVFEAKIKHWILESPVEIRGRFFEDETANSELCVVVEISGDGMTGEESSIVTLRKHDVAMEKYQVWRPDHGPNYPHAFTSSLQSPVQARSIGLSEEQLNMGVSRLISQDREQPEIKVDGILLLKDGLCVAEEYMWGYEPNARHIVASITKSVMALLAGVAWDMNLFSLEDIISDTFPGVATSWADDEPIRIKHVLSLTAGLSAGDPRRLLKAEDVVKDVLSTSRIKKPGEKWYYNNDLPEILGKFLERKTGTTIEDFAEQHLFGPLGIANYTWTNRTSEQDGKHHVVCMGGIELTMRDMGKIGQMMLSRGTWEEKRIISEAWIDLCTKRHTLDSQRPYGFMFYLNRGSSDFPNFEDAYMAMGSGEQVIYVIPSRGIVFVAVSSSFQSLSIPPVILKRLHRHILGE